MTENTEIVNSPCNELCLLDEDTGLCLGCLRTSNEIALWSIYTDTQKKNVLSEIEKRKQINKL